jgi:hypothetical protein
MPSLRPQVLSLVERGGNVRSMYLDDKNVRSALVSICTKIAAW